MRSRPQRSSHYQCLPLHCGQSLPTHSSPRDYCPVTSFAAFTLLTCRDPYGTYLSLAATTIRTQPVLNSPMMTSPMLPISSGPFLSAELQSVAASTCQSFPCSYFPLLPIHCRRNHSYTSLYCQSVTLRAHPRRAATNRCGHSVNLHTSHNLSKTLPCVAVHYCRKT